ncbi:hypothetical protein A3K86_03360 [Photobacterium jeanii]|uniref:Uncharacterized protein n=2 Tax=Photobacterium jeanii TaxID=858640 RepID=A0A178KL55_9GAMM|nr:hypothetical protein A3K86_03360 [Photobacterium jeanii]PST92360.1 hypothetical protein C9I91_04085 [Photobacterium jeanii]
MEVKSVGVNATAINYQHSPRIDGYTVSVDELNDGGDSYQDDGYTLAEGDFEFPIVGAAKVSVQHDDSFDSSYLNGDVSRIYTYQAETVDIADTQMNFNIEFVNAGWMYVTAVFKESDIAQISEIKLVANGNEVEMVKSADSQHHYFYGYVRNDAELVLNYYGQELRSNIVYNTQQGTNEGKHGEFVVSTKEGNVIITDPDWDKLEPTPIVLPPKPKEYSDVVTYYYSTADECSYNASLNSANYFAVKLEPSTSLSTVSCSWEQRGGPQTDKGLESQGFEVVPTYIPLMFDRTPFIDTRQECIHLALATPATHYAYIETGSYQKSCYIQSESGTTGSWDVIYFGGEIHSLASVLDVQRIFHETPNDTTFTVNSDSSVTFSTKNSSYIRDDYATDFYKLANEVESVELSELDVSTLFEGITFDSTALTEFVQVVIVARDTAKGSTDEIRVVWYPYDRGEDVDIYASMESPTKTTLADLQRDFDIYAASKPTWIVKTNVKSYMNGGNQVQTNGYYQIRYGSASLVTFEADFKGIQIKK